jgi:hypothetical protein
VCVCVCVCVRVWSHTCALLGSVQKFGESAQLPTLPKGTTAKETVVTMNYVTKILMGKFPEFLYRPVCSNAVRAGTNSQVCGVVINTAVRWVGRVNEWVVSLF